jgi:ATP synthase protein I
LEKFSESLRKASPYMNLGVMFLGCMLIGVFGGRWLDEKWGTEPWMLLTGSLVGMASGFYHFFRTVLRHDGKRDENKNDDDAQD